MKELKVTKLHPNAKLPTRATEQSAGLDLYAVEDFTLPGSRTSGIGVIIGQYRARTGISVQLDPGYEGTIRPRSGLAFNESVMGLFGTIDADYQGELKVLLYNMHYKSVDFKKGDRIGQLVISPVALPIAVNADKPAAPTKRGDGGFGSTGK